MPEQPCTTCGRPHVGCRGHRGPRHATDPGGPCGHHALKGQTVCKYHGGATTQATAAGERRETERKVRMKLGDAGQSVEDPIAKLCAIAGRAVAFMESLAERVDQIDNDSNRAEARADIAVYGRSIKDAASVVESIIRMGIAERLAKQDADRTTSYVAFIDGVLTELGHNPRDPKVAAVVLRVLEQAA